MKKSKVIYLHWKVLLIVRHVPPLIQGFADSGGQPKTAQPVNPSKTGLIFGQKINYFLRSAKARCILLRSSGKSLFVCFSSILVVFRIQLYFLCFFVWVNLGELAGDSRAPPPTDRAANERRSPLDTLSHTRTDYAAT